MSTLASAPRRRLPPESLGYHVSGWMRRKLRRKELHAQYSIPPMPPFPANRTHTPTQEHTYTHTAAPPRASDSPVPLGCPESTARVPHCGACAHVRPPSLSTHLLAQSRNLPGPHVFPPPPLPRPRARAPIPSALRSAVRAPSAPVEYRTSTPRVPVEYPLRPARIRQSAPKPSALRSAVRAPYAPGRVPREYPSGHTLRTARVPLG